MKEGFVINSLWRPTCPPTLVTHKITPNPNVFQCMKIRKKKIVD